MTLESAKADRLVLWYLRLPAGGYNCATHRCAAGDLGPTIMLGKHGVTRAQMLAFFFTQIQLPEVKTVAVDTGNGKEQEISDKTVEHIKAGKLLLQDLLINEEN